MPDQVAVVIGINYAESPESSGVNPLRYAEADAEAMAAALRESGYEVQLLLGAGATRRKILDALQRQGQAAGPNGRLVVYFAGHGDVDPYDSDLAYLLPADVEIESLADKGIPLEDLARRYLGKAGNVLTLLDCCHSGYAVGLRGRAQPAQVGRDFGAQAQATFGSVRDRIVIAACAGDQLARELTALGHGAFTYYALAAWRTSPTLNDQNLYEHIAQGLASRGLPDPVRGGVQEGLMVLRPPIVVAPPPPAAAPAPPGPPPRRDNLPTPPTALIGRSTELAAVTTLLRDSGIRLVTLTGPGGIGKTRLAVQVVADLRPAFDAGVVFVPLATVTDPQLVASAIAGALGVKEAGTQTLGEHLKEILRPLALLLLLDTFEQVLPAARLVADLLGAAPQLKVLVTSRTRLQVRGEKLVALRPLAVPDSEYLPPAPRLARLAASPAVQLFVARAQDLDPEFTLDASNSAAVGAICAWLDGLPLALELAAARLRLLGPAALLTRLQSRMKLLTGGARDLPTHQQTLRGTLEWSYDLLAPDEQQLFARLSIFTGGFTLAAADTVCSPAGARLAPLNLDVLDGLTALEDKSLLYRTSGPDGDPRFGMMATIREFALECLAARDEEATLRQVHAAHYLAWAEAHGAPDAQAPGAWLDQVEQEHANLRAALHWAVDHSDADVALRLCAALGEFWRTRGYLSEGRRWLEAALAIDYLALAEQAASHLGSAETHPWLDRLEHEYANLRAALQWAVDHNDAETALRLGAALSEFWRARGDVGEGRRWLEAALRLGDAARPAARARVLRQAGILAYEQGDPTRGRALLEENLRIQQALDDPQGIARATNDLGNLAYQAGDYAQAVTFFAQGLAQHRALHNPRGETISLISLGAVAHSQQDYARATELYTSGYDLARGHDFQDAMLIALSNLGEVALDQQDYPQAIARYRSGLALAQAQGNRRRLAVCLEGLAGALGATGQGERAAALFGAAQHLWDLLAGRRQASYQPTYERMLETVRVRVPSAAWQAAWDAGAAQSIDEVLAGALSA